MSVLWSIVFSVSFICFVVEAQNECTTPVREAGICVPIEQCSIHMDIRDKAPKPLSAFLMNYLIQSKCEIKNQMTYVCCGSRHRMQDTLNLNVDNENDIIKPAQDDDDRIVVEDRSDFESVIDHPSLNLVNDLKCGQLNDDKISNGNDTFLGEFPWMVQLQYQTPTGLAFRCGGSLFNKRYVLTAAHCVTRIREPVVSVRLGEHDLSKDIDCDSDDECMPPVQDIPIEEIIFHPDFNKPKYANDIAVLRLKHDADINGESVLSICLPTTPELQNNDIDLVTISGWGLTEDQSVSNILQKAVIPVISNEACQRIYKRSVRITSSQMCAGGEPGVDSCKGDSGGPLFFTGRIQRKNNILAVRYVQYGVVSAGGAECGSSVTFPGLYTRVAYYMKWILDQLRP